MEVWGHLIVSIATALHRRQIDYSSFHEVALAIFPGVSLVMAIEAYNTLLSDTSNNEAQRILYDSFHKAAREISSKNETNLPPQISPAA